MRKLKEFSSPLFSQTERDIQEYHKNTLLAHFISSSGEIHQILRHQREKNKFAKKLQTSDNERLDIEQLD